MTQTEDSHLPETLRQWIHAPVDSLYFIYKVQNELPEYGDDPVRVVLCVDWHILVSDQTCATSCWCCWRGVVPSSCGESIGNKNVPR